MKFKNKFSLFLVLFSVFMLTAIMAAGCTPSKKPITQKVKYNAAKTNISTKYNEKRDAKIAEAVKSIKGVKEATVLTNNKTAYVGIDLETKLEGSKAGKVEKEVISKVRKTDKKITKVYVSSEAHVLTRLKKYEEDIKAGKPISGLVSEIEKIFPKAIPKL